jgi:hypothetical protein
VLQGNRENIDSMAGGSQKILTQVLKLIDSHDLYGSVAYPKKHQQKDISDIYLLPFATRGIFTNVALQEPFGLTVIEVRGSRRALSWAPAVRLHSTCTAAGLTCCNLHLVTSASVPAWSPAAGNVLQLHARVNVSMGWACMRTTWLGRWLGVRGIRGERCRHPCSEHTALLAVGCSSA